VKLNVGCGDRYVEGWHNVDRADMPHRKDEACDIRASALPWSEVQFAYAGHVLEHLFVEHVIIFLEALRGCMASDGELMAVGPDVILAQGMAVAGTLDVTMDSLENGGHRWPGDEHRWHCTQWGVERMLMATGWQQIKRIGINAVPEMWPVADRRPQWQCAVSARP
jgi:predicted SAM-dependent methyltransferase